MCSSSTDRCESCTDFVMLTFLNVYWDQNKTQSQHWAWSYWLFISNRKISQICDYFAECLLTWIMYMIETISNINQFKEGGQDSWLCHINMTQPIWIVYFITNQLLLQFDGIHVYLECLANKLDWLEVQICQNAGLMWSEQHQISTYHLL